MTKISKREIKDKERFELMSIAETRLRARGFKYIAGIDEAGRGPLAGPVVAAAVILDPNKPIYGLNDSKKLSEKRRQELFPQIIDKAIAYSVCFRDQERIDEINILKATYEAMTEAVDDLQTPPDYLLIDAVRLDRKIPQEAIVKGDGKVNAIAAASILAKVSRDQLMIEYDAIYPEYNFAKNKGYGTKNHMLAIKEHGPSPLHRLSFLKNFKLGAGMSDTQKKGYAIEAEVCKFLLSKGFEIIERNFRIKNYAEIDIIAAKSGKLYIFEVKYRENIDVVTPGNSGLDRSKVKKLVRLGKYYYESRCYNHMPVHVFGVVVQPDSSGKHLKIDFVDLMQ